MTSGTGPILEAERICSRRLKEFRTDAEVLQATRVLFALRAKLESERDEEDFEVIQRLEAKLSRVLHAALRRAPDRLHIGRTFRRLRLTRVEREILLGLVLSATGMVERVSDIEDLQKLVGRRGKDGLGVVKALHGNARLVTRDLVILESGELPVLTEIKPSPSLIEPLLVRGEVRAGWAVKSYEELLDRSYRLFRVLRQRAEELSPSERWGSSEPDTSKLTGTIKRLMVSLFATAGEHPEWPLQGLFESGLHRLDLYVLVLLLGKELGFHAPGDELFTGEGLARAVSRTIPEVRHHLRLLGRDGRLRAQNYIRICGGPADTAVEDEATLRSCEFELTSHALAKLEVKRRRRDRHRARKPRVRMEQLVLSAGVRQSLEMVAAQLRHGQVLVEKWGLGDVLPYGRGVTVLFSGPPGVGKTASAEGVAEEAEKEIIVADYSEIQNCLVGETEKNIVRLFRQAAEDDAVLFWDEADAMFFDRDSASRNWEVRDVNVLLQEIEQFTGLCILATNRTVTLDKAFERRISLKVEFDRPDRGMRRKIWEKIIPARMPLSPDIDLDALSEPDLTGGEIKNVVLNAARVALARGPRAKVNRSDFDRALSMEKKGRWTEAGVVGFGG